MRINVFVAQATGVSRRQADEYIQAGRVRINSETASLGARVEDGDSVTLDGEPIKKRAFEYILLNKPVGYVCSRKAQDDKPTIYSLLPEKYHHLNPAGRLDADSCGLLILTNDGQFAHQLMHPSNSKEKIYVVKLDRELSEEDLQRVNEGVELDDGVSFLKVVRLGDSYEVRMEQGRNRQIRRTFENIGYSIIFLQRTQMGDYSLGSVEEGSYDKAFMPSTKNTS